MNAASNATDVIELDELEILVIVDNETDTLSSVDEGVPQIPEVIHVAARTPPIREFEGHECKVVLDQLCCGVPWPLGIVNRSPWRQRTLHAV